MKRVILTQDETGFSVRIEDVDNNADNIIIRWGFLLEDAITVAADQAEKFAVDNADAWKKFHDLHIGGGTDMDELEAQILSMPSCLEYEWGFDPAELEQAIRYFAKHTELSVAAGFQTEFDRDKYIALSADNNHPWQPCTADEAKQVDCYQNYYREG